MQKTKNPIFVTLQKTFLVHDDDDDVKAKNIFLKSFFVLQIVCLECDQAYKASPIVNYDL